MTYTADLIGTTWEGFEAHTSVTFDHMPTAKEIKASAGDFREILDYRLYETRISVNVIKDFEHEESENIMDVA